MSGDYLRIEKAISYLEEHFLEQPTLGEVAGHVNLSPFHFHRLFKRWAGTSPKRFLKFLTVDYAKKLLEEDRNVLDVTYEAGLSSPGRLHDLFVTVEAVTPGEFKAKGAGMEISYGIHPSPFGECLLAVTERGVCGLTFLNGRSRKDALAGLRARWQRASLKESPEATGPLAESIFRPEPLDGKTPVGLFLKGTNFQLKVWEALLKIPPGFVCSYEDIAGYLGRPSSARAVGRAVGANAVAYLIPCHRVIRKMGTLGGYRWGETRKKAMLGWEAARRRPEGVEPRKL